MASTIRVASTRVLRLTLVTQSSGHPPVLRLPIVTQCDRSHNRFLNRTSKQFAPPTCLFVNATSTPSKLLLPLLNPEVPTVPFKPQRILGALHQMPSGSSSCHRRLLPCRSHGILPSVYACRQGHFTAVEECGRGARDCATPQCVPCFPQPTCNRTAKSTLGARSKLGVGVHRVVVHLCLPNLCNAYTACAEPALGAAKQRFRSVPSPPRRSTPHLRQMLGRRVEYRRRILQTLGLSGGRTHPSKSLCTN